MSTDRRQRGPSWLPSAGWLGNNAGVPRRPGPSSDPEHRERFKPRKSTVFGPPSRQP